MDGTFRGPGSIQINNKSSHRGLRDGTISFPGIEPLRAPLNMFSSYVFE